MSPMQALYAEHDGPIPAPRRRQAEADQRRAHVRRAVAGVARVKLRIRLKAETIITSMVDKIAEIASDRGGDVCHDDLLAAGFTRDQLREYGDVAKGRAQAAMRGAAA